jgi:hypothetical protein
LLRVLLLAAGCGGTESKPGADAGVPDAAQAADAAGPDASATSAGLNPCDPAYLPMDRAAPLSCCLKDGDEWFLSGNPSSLGNLVHRRHARACSLADGMTGGCSGMDCIYGPCGASVVESFTAPAHVFHPVSDPEACGREATGLPGVPEAWTGAQEPYGTVANACPFTGCAQGTPTVKLAVTVTAATATGHVMSDPAGVDVAGAGAGSAAFSTLAITLTAAPTGDHARAVFSGDCAVTGDYGKGASCIVTLGPDKKVTVAFECEGGFTCSL